MKKIKRTSVTTNKATNNILGKYDFTHKGFAIAHAEKTVYCVENTNRKSHCPTRSELSRWQTEEVYAGTDCFSVVPLGTGQDLSTDYFHDRNQQKHIDKS